MMGPTNRAAARRALLLRNGEAHPDDILEALAWIEASAANRAAFEQAERFLVACDHALSEPDCGDIMAATVHRNDRQRRRHIVQALAASIVLAFAGAIAFLVARPSRTPDPLPITEASYASAVGETRSILLPDGSRLTLAGASSVAIAFDRNWRKISLSRGEALFRVAHDRSRPFVVSTAGGSTTAVGTAFDIHRGIDGSTVTVLHGEVEVRASGLRSRSRSRLGPMMQVRYSAKGEIGAIRKVDLPSALTWEQGKLQFVQAPLVAIIDDLNRYSPLPISLEDSTARQMRVSAVIDTHHIQDWLTALVRTGRIDMTISEQRISLRSATRKDEDRRGARRSDAPRG